MIRKVEGEWPPQGERIVVRGQTGHLWEAAETSRVGVKSNTRGEHSAHRETHRQRAWGRKELIILEYEGIAGVCAEVDRTKPLLVSIRVRTLS